ncbi:sensor histidine kinase [Pseudoflavonifractor capillosus]|uniref:sensor histidine kinase n=1 Tax=Pseudoflavonifractor capillosus TaxID=106588 RepID=UPI00195869AF|nr:sensor histidine kinase [Pseudoflavonifractor capillosus]MBM6679975.1 response regulator [Pseudoflavonifractor capillosus]
MRFRWGKTAKMLIAALLAGLLSALLFAVYNTYDAYTQMIIAQQQQHLLITARAVSQNLSLYLSEQLRNVEILTQTPGFLTQFHTYYETGDQKGLKEYVLSYMLSQNQGVSRLYLLDQNGDEVFRYNQYPFLESFDESVLHLDQLAEGRQTGLGSAFRISPQHYGLTMVNSITDGSDYLGAVVSVLDMDALYQQYMAPLQGTVDIIVKNERGTVIMHPESEMLTFNYFRDMQGLDTLPEYESLWDMLQLQYQQEEGAAIYRACSGGILPEREEISAFSRMNLSGTSWYISAVMPYSQVVRMVNENLNRFAFLVTVIFVLIASSILIIYGLQKNRQKLQIETRYLRDMNRTLEELHESREQVRHYQKLQTIGALAGGIVHEFNNLLTPIMGYSEFLKQQLGPENEYYEDIDEIYKAGGRAKEIVDQILSFSRRETDSTQYNVVNLNAVIWDTLKMVRMLLPSSVRLVVKPYSGPINIYGSATQIHQVLLNLCTNAYQAMEASGGTLTVATRRVFQDQLPEQYHPVAEGEFVRLEVSDTGCGIPPEMLSRIFDPFFTTKAAGDGTGLGLSVVQNILISHGGFIEAESAVGRGSRFLVYLPVTSQLPAAAAQEESGSGRTGMGSVLLVDDEVRVVRYFKRRLVHQGYQVDAFTDPEEALNAFRLNPGQWDLLIVDEAMPKLRGTALLQHMKQRNHSLRVILVTGLVGDSAIRLHAERQIDEILTKPVEFEALAEAVARLLSAEAPGR